MKDRHCWKCGSEIFECMGSVHVTSFFEAMLSKNPDCVVYELCPKCATYYANADPPQYPQPYDPDPEGMV
jgi:hypothetical protein